MHLCEALRLVASRRCYYRPLQVDWGCRSNYGALPLHVGARGSNKGCRMSTANAETLVGSERTTRPFHILVLACLSLCPHFKCGLETLDRHRCHSCHSITDSPTLAV